MNGTIPRVFAATLALLLTACSNAGLEQEESIATTTEALSGFPQWGAIPYPVVTNAASGVPASSQILEADGKTPIQAWDGSLADLVAADALALCSKSSVFWSKKAKTFWGLWNDDYFAYLKGLMQEASCIKPATANYDDDWLQTRTNPICNVDALGNKAKLAPLARDISLYETFSSSGYGTPADGQTGATSNYRYHNDNALGELAFADVNLCVAQQIRQYLNDGNLLFTPTSDQIELLSVMRQRAQMAMVQYSVIASTLSYTTVAPADTGAANAGPWLPIYHWSKTLSSANLVKLAADYELSIGLEIGATQELGDLLRREAAGQGNARDPYSARGRLVALMWGGDPRVNKPGTPPPGRGPAGPFNGAPSVVTQKMSEPPVQTALTLLRRLVPPPVACTNECAWHVTNIWPITNSKETILLDASYQKLYKDVETRLRLEAAGKPICEMVSNVCTEATFRSQLPSLQNFQDYELWKRHGVAPEHMKAAISALAEAFGRAESQDIDPVNGTEYPAMHVTGKHQWLGIPSPPQRPDPVLTIDPKFGIGSLRSHHVGQHYQYGAYLDPVADYNLPYLARGTNWETVVRPMTYKRYLYTGAIPALVYAKEQVLFGGYPATQPYAAPFFNALGNALANIERAIGSRSMVVRQMNTDCDIISAPNAFYVGIIERTSDPLNTLFTGLPTGEDFMTLEINPNQRTLRSETKTSLAQWTPLSQLTLSGVGAGFTVRGATMPVDAGNPSKFFFLGDAGKTQFAHFGLSINASGTACAGKYVSYGGSLNEMVEKAWATQPRDWSKPAFDGFGLPTTWFPPSSAVLAGGTDGEEPYAFYLRTAKDSAAEATAAVREAIDGLTQQTLSTTALKTAEDRAASIATIESKTLCGMDKCNLSFARYVPSVPACSIALPAAIAQKCDEVRSMIVGMLPSIMVAADVAAQATRVTPDFGKYGGSEASRILLRQWTAIRSLEAGIRALIAEGEAYGRQVEAARANMLAAQAINNATLAQLDTAFNELVNLGVQELTTQVNEVDSLIIEISTGLSDAKANRDLQCSEDAFRVAQQSGKSFAGVEGQKEEWNPETMSFWVHGGTYNEDGMSYSFGPVFAQFEKCHDADVAYNSAMVVQTGKMTVLEQKKANLLARAELTEAKKKLIGLQQDEAAAQLKAAQAADNLAISQGAASVQASLTTIQSAVNEALAASKEYEQAEARAERALSQAALDVSMANANAKARFALHRQFRSYEMWRARALLESARRSAVAARRAIETRFVVDLSDIEATQAFVEAPKTWADEVYQSDLDAPGVVGLSVLNDSSNNTVYPNKLQDYVGNLARFVEGYTVSYPTSIANPDAEIISIGGPDVRQDLTDANGVAYQIVDGASAGWDFYCPDTKTWITHPGFGQAKLTALLSKACGGKAPTRAKFSFALDPWGRFNQFVGSSPFSDRYNVRWRRLAVNVVGTGVRDCTSAIDPLSCYSDSFLRYNLSHAGPAWVADQSLRWRSIELPTAMIEGAKALAAEDWLDPVGNGWSSPMVANVGRGELFTRPVSGAYELILDLPPDVRLDRIDRIQILTETEYWVRQE